VLLNVDLPSGIYFLSISPCGIRLALGNGAAPATVVVVALPSGKEVARFEGLEESMRMAFRSETELCIGSGRACVLHNLTRGTNRVLRGADGDVGDLDCLALSRDGKTVAVGVNYRGQELLLLDATGKKQPRRLDLGRSVCAWVDAVRFSPDGRFLCAQCAPDEYDRCFRFLAVVDVKDGSLVRLLKVPWHQLHDYPVAFRPDNRVLAMAYFEKVLLFDLYPRPSPLDPDAIFGSSNGAIDMGRAAPMARFDVTERRQVAQLRYSEEGIVLKVCCINGDALLLSADELRQLGETLAPAESRAVEYGEVAISPTGTAARRLDKQTVLVWDVPWWAEA
jgi:hypothetical protein